MIKRDEMIARAFEARERAYAPYSGFAVGACVQTGQGDLFCGCNVENVSFGATCCAERAAVFAAVERGRRDIVAVAVATGHDELVWPCGLCLQVLREFGGADMVVIAATKNGAVAEATLGQLLPRAGDGYVARKEV